MAWISASLLFFSLINQSYAQEDFPDIKSLAENKTFIFVQTFVHNSQGQMVTYLASEKFSYIDTTALTNLLNFEESDADKIIEINGKQFQIIKRRMVIPIDKENVIASTIIAHSTNGTLNMVARFAHDGYPILVGEKVTTVWTFIRPIE